jgi:hypothetical protein
MLPSVFSALNRFPDPFLVVLPAVPAAPLPLVVVELVPVMAELVPVVAEPVPVVAEPVPVVAEPVPVVAEPVPVMAEPVPVVAEPMPVVAEVVALTLPKRAGVPAVDDMVFCPMDVPDCELVPIVEADGLAEGLVVLEVLPKSRGPVTVEVPLVDFCEDVTEEELSVHDAFHCHVKEPDTDSVIEDPSAAFPWRLPMKRTAAPSWSVPLNSTLVGLKTSRCNESSSPLVHFALNPCFAESQVQVPTTLPLSSLIVHGSK